MSPLEPLSGSKGCAVLASPMSSIALTMVKMRDQVRWAASGQMFCFENDVGDIIAIYDVKTGQAGLSPGRVREIRRHTGVLSNVPIIELHILRKASIKSSSLRVLARLWRPEDHQGSRGLAEDQ